MAPSFKERDGLFASIDCADWDDFKASAQPVLRELANSNTLFEKYIFRGQSCSSWKLTPSFDRKHFNLSYAELERYYELVIDSFKTNYDVYGGMDSAARELFRREGQPGTRHEYETLAQHFGLQTRLMDWSRSIYVAAFFAFSRVDQCGSDMVSVWALDWRTITREFSNDHLELFDQMYRENRRQLWQLGVLVKNRTEHSDMVDLFRQSSRHYSPKLREGPPCLIRFDIPREARQEAIDDLNMMRINSVTLFPGIEGVVQWIERGGIVLD